MSKQSQIKKVLDKRSNESGSLEYLVEWNGQSQAQWEPIINLKEELEVLADFEVEYELKKKKQSIQSNGNGNSERQKKQKKKVTKNNRARSSSSEDEEYEVEEILNKKTIKGIMNYQVKWKGYPVSESTWEPLKNLSNAKEAVKKYEEKNKKFLGVDEMLRKKTKKVESDEQNEEIIQPTINSTPKNEEEKEDKIEQEFQKHLEISEKGHFETDEPLKILSVRPSKELLYMIVSWKPRPNGITPKDSQFTNKEIFQYNPKLLVDFYEAKLRFTKSKTKEEKMKFDQNNIFDFELEKKQK